VPSTPSQILEQIRAHYLARLRQAIEDQSSDGILHVVHEAALRDTSGELLRRGDPPAPVRVDLVTLINGQIRDGSNIESETMPGFAPLTLRWRHELPVKISPFPWNACPVQWPETVSHVASIVDWFEHWFDPEETRRPGDSGLLGVVHSIAKTPAAPGTIRLLIDLGSAPVEAFEELIEALHASGAQSAEIGSSPPTAERSA
jgi:hypothetical protein